MSIRNIQEPQAPDNQTSHSSKHLNMWLNTFSRNVITYSASILLATAGIVAIGLLTGTTIVLLPVAMTLLMVSSGIHIHLSSRNDAITSELLDAAQRLVSEASASRILGGIKILRGNDWLSPDARLANAARMATEYPAAIVFNLREAHGVLAPSNWSYEGQLGHIRDHFEAVDSNEPGALAARQGSAIVISNTDESAEDLPSWAEQAGFSQGIVTPLVRGLDTVGVVYVLKKSASLPNLREIEQLELIVNFSSTSASSSSRDSAPTQSQPFRVVEKQTASRGSELPPIAPIRMSGFALNPESERMEMDGVLISLSPTEFMLMHTLASSPDQPISPVELMDRCWTKESRPADNAVDVAIFRLRKKLNKTVSGKGLIKTVRGSGYMFIPPAVEANSPVVAD